LVLDDETAQRAAAQLPLERIPLGGQGALYRLPTGLGETIGALDIRDGILVPAYGDAASAGTVDDHGR
jgi:hypothetical protein